MQEFRAKLILNEQALAIFQRSLRYAREKGYLKNRQMRMAMDTTHILGKAAVKDTYNLLADAIQKLYRRLSQCGIRGVVEKFKAPWRRYFGKSFKGEAQINWDDDTARKQLLTSLVADAQSLLAFAKEALSNHTDEAHIQKIREDASLLASLLLQDIETTADGQAQIKEGVAKDRLVSTTDPEMRHGRKSSSTRFDGHKVAIATDTQSQLITAVEVIAGNAHDSTAATTLVNASQANTGNEVEAAIGDCAFGTTETREEFEDRPTELIAKAPQAPQSHHFTKHDFTIALENDQVTCPAGHTTSTYKWVSVRFGQNQDQRLTKQFVFPQALCAACPLRERCIKSKAGRARVIRLHPREDLLQQARAECSTEHFKERYRERVVVEHSIARLAQRGIRKSRFFGRRRTLWQVAVAAAVVNLMLIARNVRQKAGSNSSFLYYWVQSYTTIMEKIAILLPGEWQTPKLAFAILCVALRTSPTKRGCFRPSF